MLTISYQYVRITIIFPVTCKIKRVFNVARLSFSMNASAEAPFFLRNATTSQPFLQLCYQANAARLSTPRTRNVRSIEKRTKKTRTNLRQLEQLEQLAVQAAEEIFCRTPEQTCCGDRLVPLFRHALPKKTNSPELRSTFELVASGRQCTGCSP